MELQTSLIDLDSIQVKNNFPEPDPQKLLYLANTTVELEGLLRIPVVRQLGIDNYELISGFSEYKAYLKAREIEPKLPDRLRVFITEPKNEKSILKQIEAFEKIKVPSELNSCTDNSIAIENLTSAISNLEKKFQENLEKVKSEMLEAIDSKLPTPLPLLQAFNQIQNPRIAEMVTKKLAGLLQKKGQKIVERLRQIKEQEPEREFKTFEEVILALGKDYTSKRPTNYISEKTILKIIDNWN